MNRLLSLFSLLFVSLLPAVAQNSESYLNDIGSTAYGINIPVENGFIDISNGNLHLEFQLAAHPQRGALSLNESLVYDSRIWMFSPFGTKGSYHWWPYNVPGSSTSSGGWRLVKGLEVGTTSYVYAADTSKPVFCPDTGYSGSDQESVMQLYWTDPAGTAHPFNAGYTIVYDPCTGTTTQTNPYFGGAGDGSGYNSADDGTGNPLITDNSGTEVYPQIVDRYGNYFSSDANGNLVDDTGRIPVITTTSGNTTYYDVLSPNGGINDQGTRVRYTVTSASVNVSTNFGQQDTYEWTSPGLLTPVQSILLPDGSQYSFTYDSYGELNSVTLPTGGVIKYGYSNFSDSSKTENRWLTSRTVGSNPSMTFTPTVVTTCQNYSTGCVESVNLHKPSGDETVYQLTLNNGNWNTGTTTYSGSATTGTKLLQITNANTYTNGCTSVPLCDGGNYLSQELTTTALYANPSLTQGKTVYSQSQVSFNSTVGKISDEKDWDYVTTSPSTTTAPTGRATREIQYTYTGVDPYQVTVLDSSGNQAGQTTYGYTTSATATSGVTGHGTQNAGGPYLKTVSHWLNTGGTSTTTYKLDDTGMVVSVVDPNSNPASSMTYQCSNSLPYQTTNPLSQITQYSYDCASGAIQGVKDPNDLANKRSGTTYAYESVAGRLYTQTRPDGGVTTYSYPSATEVDTATTATPDPTISSSTIVDTFGRPSESITAGTEVDTSYDSNGRANCTSNPYTQGGTTSGSTCISSYDGLDRPLKQTQADGSSTLLWSYSANTTSATNEASQTWTRTLDSFGRLTSVVEPGALTTNYTYDGLGNTSSISQLGNATNGDTSRIRSFLYDSMSHLLRSNAPESGTVCYGQWTSPPKAVGCISGYDANGNLLVETDARGTTTSYSYDALNRLTQKSYSDGTSQVNLRYDEVGDWGSQGCAGNQGFGQYTQCNTVGRLSSMWKSDNTASSIFGYDSMGRMTMQASCVVANCGNGAYGIYAGYDLAGNETSLQYPDGRLVQNSFDAAARVSGVAYPSWNGTVVKQTYFSEASGYDAAGHLVNGSFGNGVAIGAAYDSRERMSALNYGPSTAPLWSKQLAWTANSNLQSQTDLITGVQRQFGYDNLNRLTSAQDIYSNLAVPSGSNGETISTSTSGSGAAETPGATGAVPVWTNPDDSNVLPGFGEPAGNWNTGNATSTMNAAVAPDGTMTAVAITGGASNNWAAGFVPNPYLYDNETMGASVWLRAASGTMSTYIFIIDSGANGWQVAGAQPVTLTTNWQQFQISAAVQNSLSQLYFQVADGPPNPASGQTFYMWNPMMEDEGTAGTTVTNFEPYSQRLTAGSWYTNLGAVSDNSATAPDGTNTASTVTSNAGNTDTWLIDAIQNPAPLSGAPVAGSVWLRVPSGTAQVQVSVFQDGSSWNWIGGASVTVTTTWQRFQVEGVTQANLGYLHIQIGGNYSITNGQVINVWGAQVELASSAGIYVPTAGSVASASTTLTNILPYSQQLTGPSWSGLAYSVAPNAATAPDGSQTASTVTANSGATAPYIVDYVANPALYEQQTVTASVYLRVNSGTMALAAAIGQQVGSSYPTCGSVTSFTLNTNWQRFAVTCTTTNALSQLYLQLGAGNFQNGQSFQAWGAQMQIGSSAGPYIATTALPIVTGSQPVNVFPNSQTLNGPSAGSANGSLSPNTATAPDGTTTAATFTAAANSTDSYFIDNAPNPTLYDGETVTGSVYLRVSSGTLSTSIYLVNVGDNGWSLPNYIPVTLTTQWQRFSVTGINQDGLSQLSLQIGGAQTVTKGQSFQIWGPQLVVGSSPDPYTPTTNVTTVIGTGAVGTPVPTGLNQTYAYDSFGNILQNGSFTSTYTANNQMFGFAYDAAGNLLSNGYSAMTWDAESRLTSMAGANYIYDSIGNRVEKQGIGVTDTYYFGSQPIARCSPCTGPNVQWTDLIYGPTGLLAEVPGTQTAAPMYRLTDNLGTTIGTLLSNGTMVDPIDHTPFGQVLTGSTNDPFLFTGLERDPESGLDHAEFRQYASTYGRWTSPDPYLGSIDASNPQTFNRYAYVGNMPLSFTDPSGLMADGPQPSECSGPCEVFADLITAGIESLFKLLVHHHTLYAATNVRRTASGSTEFDATSNMAVFEFGWDSLTSGARIVARVGGTAAPNKPTKPCNDANNNRSRFFQQLPGLTSVAKQLNVPTNFIVGLSSFESGWFDNHNVALNNLWGLTQGGGNNIHFSSIQAGNNYFVSNVGPFIQGAQTQAAFFKGLQAEGYNSVNPNYYPTLANRINNIQSWGQACGVSF